MTRKKRLFQLFELVRRTYLQLWPFDLRAKSPSLKERDVETMCCQWMQENPEPEALGLKAQVLLRDAALWPPGMEPGSFLQQMLTDDVAGNTHWRVTGHTMSSIGPQLRRALLLSCQLLDFGSLLWVMITGCVQLPGGFQGEVHLFCVKLAGTTIFKLGCSTVPNILSSQGRLQSYQGEFPEGTKILNFHLMIMLKMLRQARILKQVAHQWCSDHGSPRP
eukprot:s1214_g12.t1